MRNIQTETLPSRVCAVVAIANDGRVAGFKLAYEKERNWLHSWLGGVAPAARGQGLARRLIEAQHEWAGQDGFEAVTTSTRQLNRAMAVVNLTAGFVISGFEQAPGKPAVVHWYKSLT